MASSAPHKSAKAGFATATTKCRPRSSARPTGTSSTRAIDGRTSGPSSGGGANDSSTRWSFSASASSWEARRSDAGASAIRGETTSDERDGSVSRASPGGVGPGSELRPPSTPMG